MKQKIIIEWVLMGHGKEYLLTNLWFESEWLKNKIIKRLGPNKSWSTKFDDFPYVFLVLTKITLCNSSKIIWRKIIDSKSIFHAQFNGGGTFFLSIRVNK